MDGWFGPEKRNHIYICVKYLRMCMCVWGATNSLGKVFPSVISTIYRYLPSCYVEKVGAYFSPPKALMFQLWLGPKLAGHTRWQCVVVVFL